MPVDHPRDPPITLLFCQVGQQFTQPDNCVSRRKEGKSKKAKGKREDDEQRGPRQPLTMKDSVALILTDESHAVFHLNSFAFCLFTFAFH
jgi:hypothetical protein